MANVKIGNKVFNDINTVQFPSADDPTYMHEFESRALISDIIYPTEYEIKITVEEQPDGSAIVYMGTDTTTLAGNYPLPITTINSMFLLICENDDHTQNNCINGYLVPCLGGKPYYARAEEIGYTYMSQRNAAVHRNLRGSLYNTEWGTEEGKYSFLKYSSSDIQTMKNSNIFFTEKICRLYAFRYPTVQIESSLGDTVFKSGGEVIVNE